MDIKTALSKKSTDYLADLVILLLEGLNETKRLDFIAKHIDAGLIIKTLALEENEEDIVQNVEDFCLACINGEYYVEAEYDDYYDEYDEADYANSEWAAYFAEYIRLAVVYARSGDTYTSYEMLARLIGCIEVCEQNYEALGTSSPLDYIDVDIYDAFEVYFSVILKEKEDTFWAYNKMLDIWMRFERYCEPLLYTYITDLALASNVVVHAAKKNTIFSENEKLFLMLEKLFIKRGEMFDKLGISKQLLSRHDNFSYYVACGYYERSEWANAISTAEEYLERTSENIKLKLKTLLTDAYEKNGQLREAYDNSLSMFCEQPSYILYKRTRHLAEKLDEVGAVSFFELSKEHLSTSTRYKAKETYMEILSYEGKIEGLINSANKGTVAESYYVIKYAAKALIYRALNSVLKLPQFLSEYLTAIKDSKPDGIIDMLSQTEDCLNTQEILLSAIVLLKKQIQFHIDAATRSRYAKAAYYLGVVVDIYGYLGEAENGKAYVSLLLSQNSRRPAFKDEVRKKLGAS